MTKTLLHRVEVAPSNFRPGFWDYQASTTFQYSMTKTAHDKTIILTATPSAQTPINVPQNSGFKTCFASMWMQCKRFRPLLSHRIPYTSGVRGSQVPNALKFIGHSIFKAIWFWNLISIIQEKIRKLRRDTSGSLKFNGHLNII
jgi:hypothetical protein